MQSFLGRYQEAPILVILVAYPCPSNQRLVLLCAELMLSMFQLLLPLLGTLPQVSGCRGTAATATQHSLHQGADSLHSQRHFVPKMLQTLLQVIRFSSCTWRSDYLRSF